MDDFHKWFAGRYYNTEDQVVYETKCKMMEAWQESAREREETLTVGKYTITRYHAPDYWIECEDGEGMQVFEKNMIDLIDKFYKEEF